MNMAEQIKFLLELYPTETELFDVLDIELEEVLMILLMGGHIKMPEFVER